MEKHPNIQFEFNEIANGFLVVFKKTTQKTTQKKATKDKILELFSKNPKYTRKDVAKILKISENAVKQHIAELKASGILKRIGSDRSGYWEIIKIK